MPVTTPFIKLILLEISRNYDNRAVVGGLEKSLPLWESLSRSKNIPEDIQTDVRRLLLEYPLQDPSSRVGTLQKLLDLIAPSFPDELKPGEETIQPVAKPNQVQATALPPKGPQHQPKQEAYHQPAPSVGPTTGMDAPLTVLQGIGPENAKKLKSLGLSNLGDLLYYFPRRYDDYSKLKPINRIQIGEDLTIIGSVYSVGLRPIRNGKQKLVEAIITDGTGFLRLSWFNQEWIATRLHKDLQIVVSGHVDLYLGKPVINNPDWELLEQEHLNTNRIVPVYPLTAGITQKFVRRLMHQSIPFWAPRIPEHIPQDILQATRLPSLSFALSQIHFPDTQDNLQAAQNRLAFDEVFLLQLGVLRQKRTWKSSVAATYDLPDEVLDRFKSSLPYQLTGAQCKAIEDIRTDLMSGKPMDRLLQGDVGSGKTVVAAIAALAVTQNNAQAAFMAPTSILAEQHFRTLLRLLAETSGTQFLKAEQIALLLGDTPEAEKRAIRSGLEDGSIKLVVGTHALIEDPIIFANLQLIVIDEQHRFGVAQRSALRAKGNSPHLLVMTATPIPRSLALTIYGDLDLTVMDEMPGGRLPIETYVLHPLERERAYSLILSQIALGHQAFIIYPLVENEDEDENKAAVQEQARLQSDIFPNQSIGLLHGRMKQEEKDAVMRQFRAGEFQILVSTSVVEVGVDIPNATVMLVESANRFGLSQLHQFRGRVGRGEAQSYCLLIPDEDDAVENQRLTVMTSTNDGFVLAEKDLEQRGPGEFLGTRQSGFSTFQLATLTDLHMIELARQQAESLFERDPDLQMPENRQLKVMLDKRWSEASADAS